MTPWSCSIRMEQNTNSDHLDNERIVANMAKTDHPISEIIAKRWSARAFSTRPVEFSKLLSILEALDIERLPLPTEAASLDDV
jgi:hypothetical protein